MNTPPIPMLRILVVDDNEVNRDVLGAYLNRLNCEVHLAAGGPEALEFLKTTSVDLILMDCQMPHMNGYDATRAIRVQSKASPQMAVIGVTASDADDVQGPCRDAGMDGVVSKPVTTPVLQDLLARWACAVDARALNAFHEEVDEAGSFENYHKAVASYLEDAPDHVAAVAEAAGRGDVRQVKLEAHILKGSSSYFGAHRLKKLCVTLEKLSETQELSDLPAHASALQKEFERVRQALISDPLQPPQAA